MDLKSGMIFGSTFTSRKNLLKWVRHIAHIFQKAGHKLTLIRADNEFNTKNIKDFCLTEHIDIVFSRPYQKDKTHRVERSHRTVQESVVKMINDRTHLDFRFWCYAFHHTLALLNLRPDSTGISPYRHWHGYDFDILKYPIIPFGSIMAAHIPLAKQHALSGRSSPGIVVGFSTFHTHSLRIWDPKTKRVTTRGTMKFLGPNPQPTTTFQYSTDHFHQPSHHHDSLLLSPHSLSMDPPVNTPSELGGTTTLSSPEIPDESGGTTDIQEELGGTDVESIDIAPYRPISRKYNRGCPQKYFSRVNCSFHDTADNLSFKIVRITYNPDFKEKYFYKYYDTSLYTTPPIDDNLFEYTSTKELWSDPDIIFLPKSSPVVAPSPPDVGPSTRPSLNLVTIGYVRPDVCPRKEMFFLPGKPRANKSPPATPITRSQYFRKKSLLLNITKTIQKHQINAGGPLSYRQVLRHPKCAELLAAWNGTGGELDSLKSMECFGPLDVDIKSIPKGQIIPSKLIFSIVFNADGSFKKYKCRLVLRGDLYHPSFELDTFAGTARAESLRLLLAICNSLDLQYSSADIRTAFLYPSRPTDPAHSLYIRRPPGATDADMPPVVKLLKEMYGLPEAARAFNEHLDRTLRDMGFHRLQSDPQLYLKRIDPDDFIIISTHVDDLFIISQQTSNIQDTLNTLRNTYQLTTIDDPTSHLGLHIAHDRDKGIMTLDQTAFIDNLLNEHGFIDATERETPMNTVFPETDGTTLSPELHTVYRSKLGSLQFLAALTRPDILFATNYYSRRAMSPSSTDMVGVDDILKYLKHTRTLGLTFHKGDIHLYATADAAFDVYPDSKSHSGGTIHLGSNSASFFSMTQKQPIIADSSTEAEFISAHSIANTIIWLRGLLDELGFPQTTSTHLMQDNQSTIRLLTNKGASAGRTKHLRRRFNGLREHVMNGDISVHYLASDLMIADILTKPLGPTAFLTLRPLLMGSPSPSSSS